MTETEPPTDKADLWRCELLADIENLEDEIGDMKSSLELIASLEEAEKRGPSIILNNDAQFCFDGCKEEWAALCAKVRANLLASVKESHRKIFPLKLS